MTNTEEIEFLKDRIKEHKKEIDKLHAKAQHDDFAETVRSVYDSLLAQGFDADQAYNLLILALKSIFQLGN